MIRKLLLIGCIIIAVFSGLLTAEDIDNTATDSSRVRNPEKPKPGVGEVLLSIPSEIVKLPVYAVKGIAWGTVHLVSQPSVKKLFNFGNPFAPFFITAGYGDNKGLSAGSGVGLYHNLVPNDKLKFQWYYSTHRYQSYQIKYDAHNLFARSGDLKFRAEYKKRPREEFHGLGNDSEEGNEFNYTLERSRIFANYTLPAKSFAKVMFNAGFIAANVYDGEDTDDDSESSIDSILSRFPEDYRHVRASKIAFIGLGVLIDRRDVKGQPSKGALLELSTSYNVDVSSNDNPSFFVTRFDGSKFIELFNKRVLSFRFLIESTDHLSDNDNIPFYHLSTLGGRDDLRGYGGHRFYDKDLALFTVEYSYPIWKIIDAFVFLDEGRVFEDIYSEMTFKSWHADYGFGMRFWTAESVIFKTQAAFSSGEPRFYFEMGASL